MSERVELPRPLAIRLLHAAQLSPDREVCGLIAAYQGQPHRVISIGNAASEPRRLFDMDERELIDAMKSMRERGETLFAIWHSHPDSAPEPSAADIEQAGYPDALHLIVSLQTKGVLQMRGWRYREGEAVPVEVGVREDT